MASVTLMHQNFQCIRNKLYQLEIIINHDLKKLDILCCTEHWLNTKEITYCHIPDFNLSSYFCRDTYKNGGTAIFVRQHLSHIEKKNTYYLNQDKVFEHAVTEISGQDYNLTVVCVYRSPDGCIKTFLEKFELLLNHLKSKKKQLILCGDFNIDFLNSDATITEFRSLIRSYNLIETIDTPTRIASNSKTCLDQIIIDHDSYPFSVGNIDMGIADHNAVFLNIYVFENPKPNSIKPIRYKRSFNDENVEYFKRLLSKENWIEVTNLTDVDAKTNEFINSITHYFDVAFPLKKCTLTNKQFNNSKNWITKGIVTSCRRKKELYKLCQITNSLDLKLHYKRYTSILKKVIHAAKLKFNGEFIMKAQNRGKAIWEVVKKETCKNTKVSNQDFSIIHNGQTIQNSFEIAEIFNKFFANVADNPNNQVTGSQETTLHGTGNVNTIFLSPVTADEILDIIKKLKNNLSCGPDDIPDGIVKKCAVLLVAPLVNICNSSLISGKFPEQFKLAKVCPIFKKGDKQNINNYRPISLLSTFSKILEKVMYNRLVRFLDCNGALSNAQFGFQKGKGINNAIFTFTEFILNSKDNKNQTVGLFLDLSKAFDTVDHMILIQKLQWFGIRGLAKSWFVSYLSARQQFVEIGSMKSYPTIMKSGVPQGSILGPILFLLYINDLPSRITQAKTVLFADDTNIVFNALDKNNLQEKINETSRQLEQWLASNRLKLNVSKTVCMYFSQKQLHDSIEILLNNTGIKDVDCTKFLGIWIDSNLTWESHIQFLTDKLSRLCYAFRVLTNITPKELLRAVYFGYVHSVLSYGIIIWGSSSKLAQVFRLQKRILKIIKKVPIRSDSKKIFKEFDILPLPCIYILETVCFIHQNYDSFKINSDYHNYSTRTCNNLHFNHHRLSKSLNSLSHTGIRLYNKLPVETKALNYARFKKSVKHILLFHMPFTVNEYLSLALQI